jgi:hypothetical protein
MRRSTVLSLSFELVFLGLTLLVAKIRQGGYNQSPWVQICACIRKVCSGTTKFGQTLVGLSENKSDIIFINSLNSLDSV